MGLKHQGIIESWHDRRILAGEEWAGRIDDELCRADMILLLISADFIASKYCYETEMKEALSRHHRGEAKVIPIILRPCDWEELPFNKLKALPRDGKAIAKYPNRDDAFVEIAKGLRDIAKPLLAKTGISLSNSLDFLDQTKIVSDKGVPRSSNIAIQKLITDHDCNSFVTSAEDDIFLRIINLFYFLFYRNKSHYIIKRKYLARDIVRIINDMVTSDNWQDIRYTELDA